MPGDLDDDVSHFVSASGASRAAGMPAATRPAAARLAAARLTAARLTSARLATARAWNGLRAARRGSVTRRGPSRSAVRRTGSSGRWR
jgi:hypothetical protein